jgi:hypothetical protein
MALLFKLLALLTSLATTVLLLVESARRGLLLFWTILGVLKVLVFVVFLGLLLFIGYLLLKPQHGEQSAGQ